MLSRGQLMVKLALGKDTNIADSCHDPTMNISQNEIPKFRFKPTSAVSKTIPFRMKDLCIFEDLPVSRVIVNKQRSLDSSLKEVEINDLKAQISKTHGNTWNELVLQVRFKNEYFARKYQVKIEKFLKDLLEEGEEFIVCYPSHNSVEQDHEGNHQCFDTDGVTCESNSRDKLKQNASHYSSHFEDTLSTNKFKTLETPTEENVSSKSLHKLLQQSVQMSNNMRTVSKEDAPQTFVAHQNVCQTKENEEILAHLNYDELCVTINGLYNSALEPSGDILHFAKMAMKMVASYFKEKGESCFEKNVQNFMEENLLMTTRKISEQYKMPYSQRDKDKIIKECQMQALLFLELEALIVSPDRENCVTSVLSLLRMMGFHYGDEEQLNKFLFYILRENYSHNLYDVIDEIADELDIPIFGEKESTDSSYIYSSDLADGKIVSLVPSDIVEQPSYSPLSKKDDNRKLVRHRSDLPSTKRMVQVSLPVTSPKKKIKLSGQRNFTRYSSRLVSRKNNEQTEVENGKSRKDCHSLFLKEMPHQTPKKHKSSQPTISSNKKAEYLDVVAETPSYKQVRSVCQRRMCLLDLLSASKQVWESSKRPKDVLEDAYVAETPTLKQNHSSSGRRNFGLKQQSTQDSSKDIVKSSKSLKNIGVDAKKQHVQKLNKTSLQSSKKDTSSTFPSFPQYTPKIEGRRRSLHLVSKLFSSPNARIAKKICPKRLLDQDSPKKAIKTKKV